jgi:hypothetical protein
LDKIGGMNVARGVALCVTLALISNLSLLCIYAGVYERHLLEN